MTHGGVMRTPNNVDTLTSTGLCPHALCTDELRQYGPDGI